MVIFKIYLEGRIGNESSWVPDQCLKPVEDKQHESHLAITKKELTSVLH